MVKVGKMWGDADFMSLQPYSKLLYCYLITQPSITTLGVLSLNKRKILLDLGLPEDNPLEKPMEELESNSYIRYLKESDTYTIVVSGHYKSLPKSKSNIRKAIDEGKKSKGELRKIFGDLFTMDDFTGSSFKAPTPEEVSDYAMELGYQVNGKDFVEYYSDNDWYDKNNKKVRAWKAKLKKVWCREENKLETVKGAPKGFEYFFVDTEEGVRIFPESWKNGKPSHSNFIYAEHLITEFNERNS